KPQTLERGNDAISPEYCAKPRNTSVRIRAIGRFRSHHVEIGERTVQPIVELFVSGKNLGFSGAYAFERTRRLLHNAFVTRRDLVSRIAIYFARNCAPVA